MDDVAIIEKILRSMIPKFDYVMGSIDESNDLNALAIDELQSSLLVHEQCMNACGRTVLCYSKLIRRVWNEKSILEFKIWPMQLHRLK